MIFAIMLIKKRKKQVTVGLFCFYMFVYSSAFLSEKNGAVVHENKMIFFYFFEEYFRIEVWSLTRI